jgi:hypothetical protein
VRKLLTLLVVVVLLGALVVGVDAFVASEAESRAEARVEEALGVPADVTLHGWPVGLRILAGKVERADVVARGVPVEGMPGDIDRLDVRLTGVQVSWSDIRSPESDLPPADSGRFEARLGSDATFGLAQVPRSVASMRIADGAIRLRVLGMEAAADVDVQGGEVVIVPRTVLGGLLATSIPLDVSDQPGGPEVEEAEIDGDVLVLRGVLTEVGTQEASGFTDPHAG